jgi:hypothetical protein
MAPVDTDCGFTVLDVPAANGPGQAAATTQAPEAAQAMDDALPPPESEWRTEIDAVTTGDLGGWVNLAVTARERLDRYLQDVGKYRASAVAAGIPSDEEAIDAGARRIIEQLAAVVSRDATDEMRTEPVMLDGGDEDTLGANASSEVGGAAAGRATDPTDGADRSGHGGQKPPPSPSVPGGNQLVDVGLGNPATFALGVRVGRRSPKVRQLSATPGPMACADPTGSAPPLFESGSGDLVDVGLGNPEVPGLGRVQGSNGPSTFLTDLRPSPPASQPVATPRAAPPGPAAAPRVLPPLRPGAMESASTESSEPAIEPILQDEHWDDSLATGWAIGRPPPSRFGVGG